VEGQDVLEYMELTDPTFVESLKLMTNAKHDGSMAILQGRAAKIQAKFNQLTA